jgi:hypothetical protein
MKGHWWDQVKRESVHSFGGKASLLLYNTFKFVIDFSMTRVGVLRHGIHMKNYSCHLFDRGNCNDWLLFFSEHGELVCVLLCLPAILGIW